jgi:hypothetical protein
MYAMYVSLYLISCVPHNLMTVNIMYTTRKHLIICAGVSGVILFPDYYVVHDFVYVMIMFALFKLYPIMYIMFIMHIVYNYSLCVLCTLKYVLCTHNAHKILMFYIEWT